MLVLTRKTGESLIIGNQKITITVLSIKNGQVKIGIEAPKHISVHRDEIYKRIQDALSAHEIKLSEALTFDSDSDSKIDGNE